VHQVRRKNGSEWQRCADLCQICAWPFSRTSRYGPIPPRNSISRISFPVEDLRPARLFRCLLDPAQPTTSPVQKVGCQNASTAYTKMLKRKAPVDHVRYGAVSLPISNRLYWLAWCIQANSNPTREPRHACFGQLLIPEGHRGANSRRILPFAIAETRADGEFYTRLAIRASATYTSGGCTGREMAPIPATATDPGSIALPIRHKGMSKIRSLPEVLSKTDVCRYTQLVYS
jgi:hypothetical protein